MRRYPPPEVDIDKCSLFPPGWGTPPRADPWLRPRLGDLCLFCVGELPRAPRGDDDDEVEPERDRLRRPGACDRLRLERLWRCCLRGLAGGSATAGASATVGTDIDDVDDGDDDADDTDDEDGVGVGVGAGAPATDGCEARS